MNNFIYAKKDEFKMQKHNESYIDTEEISRQKDIMNKVARENEGKGKLACVITYGCQQNENDSERIKGMLTCMGYGMTEEKADADVIIFNTCAVRENAELKLKGNVGALRALKAKKPDLIIGVCGCMMQQEQIAKDIFKKWKHISIIFGTHALYRFPEIIFNAIKKERVFEGGLVLSVE